MILNISVDSYAFAPQKAHEADAGFDLRSPKDAVVPTGGSCVIDTGVHVAIPFGYVGMLKSKSGLNIKHGILSDGVIDSGYTGSIVAKLYNHGKFDYVINKGDKITQLVIMPIANFEVVSVVCELPETERGSNGFGSTGR